MAIKHRFFNFYKWSLHRLSVTFVLLSLYHRDFATSVINSGKLRIEIFGFFSSQKYSFYCECLWKLVDVSLEIKFPAAKSTNLLDSVVFNKAQRKDWLPVINKKSCNFLSFLQILSTWNKAGVFWENFFVWPHILLALITFKNNNSQEEKKMKKINHLNKCCKQLLISWENN